MMFWVLLVFDLFWFLQLFRFQQQRLQRLQLVMKLWNRTKTRRPYSWQSHISLSIVENPSALLHLSSWKKRYSMTVWLFQTKNSSYSPVIFNSSLGILEMISLRNHSLKSSARPESLAAMDGPFPFVSILVRSRHFNDLSTASTYLNQLMVPSSPNGTSVVIGWATSIICGNGIYDGYASHISCAVLSSLILDHVFIKSQEMTRLKNSEWVSLSSDAPWPASALLSQRLWRLLSLASKIIAVWLRSCEDQNRLGRGTQLNPRCSLCLASICTSSPSGCKYTKEDIVREGCTCCSWYIPPAKTGGKCSGPNQRTSKWHVRFDASFSLTTVLNKNNQQEEHPKTNMTKDPKCNQVRYFFNNKTA